MPLYRVIGRNAVLGFQPGVEFDMDLDIVQEDRLVAGGHLQLLAEPAAEGRAIDALAEPTFDLQNMEEPVQEEAPEPEQAIDEHDAPEDETEL